MWIKTTDKLPPLGKFVLAKVNKSNWIHPDPNVTTVVVERIKDKYPEHNNQKPYRWETFGPSSFFGQDVIAWMPIPPLTE
jgi:hypothetical protein